MKAKMEMQKLDISIIEAGSETALVEYFDAADDAVKRCYLPVAVLADQVDEEVLSAGIPWAGDDFSKFTPEPVTSTALVEQLHRAGIWTKRDVVEKQAVVLGVINKVYKLELSRFIGAILEE